MNNQNIKANLLAQCEELYDTIKGPEGIENAGYTTLAEDVKQGDWALVGVTATLLEAHAEKLREIAAVLHSKVEGLEQQ